MEKYAWIILIILFFVFLMFRTYFFKSGSPETASGAIVMALGIFGNGVSYHFSLFDPLGPLLSIGLFLVWIFIAASFVKLAINHDIKNRHMQDPIQTFAVGTWVAGTSVCAVVMVKRIPAWEWLAQVMAIMAVLLWLYYVTLCIKNYRAIWKLGLYRKANGVILLSAVSTQSMAILFATLYNNLLPNWFYSGIIFLGIVFYFIGFYLIIKRYALSRNWNIADDWPNTNCILHGAMSITGLACAVTGAINPNMTLLIWFWVLLWFVIIESIEVWRAIARIRKYGVIKGIWVYHVSQWSRNFTFGMLFAFTLFFDFTQTSWFDIKWILQVQSFILDYGSWIFLSFLLNECVLILKEKLDFSMIKVNRQRGL